MTSTRLKRKKKKRKDSESLHVFLYYTSINLIFHRHYTTPKGIFCFCMTPLGNDLQLYTPVLKCDAVAISVGYKNINYF